jgi:ferric-dicitrate binding protein FerR (iron transport regulator)
MEYLDYSLEDFLADERFQQWILSPEKENCQFWENWLEAHPEKQPLIEQASQMLKLMALHENPAVGDKQIEKVWQRIEGTRKMQMLAKGRESKQIGMWQKYQRIAAVFTGLLLCGIVLYLTFKPSGFVEYSTGYGKTKTILLPDQSTVMLNSNSTIRFASHWDADKPREVWVDGEAYFSVVHTKNHQIFKVKTASNMNVEVLGTQFNVKNRNSGTRVTLKSGKVKLLINQNNQEKQVMMQPSESVELTQTTAGFIKTKIDPQQYLAWTQHRLIFKNTTLAEIKTLLEETYGLFVKIPDKGLLNQKISGSVPSDNLESLLFALSESFNYKIIQKKDQLLFLEKPGK